jgi:hypothetical protein
LEGDASGGAALDGWFLFKDETTALIWGDLPAGIADKIGDGVFGWNFGDDILGKMEDEAIFDAEFDGWVTLEGPTYETKPLTWGDRLVGGDADVPPGNLGCGELSAFEFNLRLVSREETTPLTGEDWLAAELVDVAPR